METDITSVIIGLSCLLIFCAPIIYYETYKKKAAKRFESYFRGHVLKSNLSLGQYDIWRESYALGLNTTADTLIYLRKKNGQEELIIKKLDEFRDCRMVRNNPNARQSGRQTDNKGDSGLVLTYKTAGNPPLYLEFFNQDSAETILDELTIANKWASSIQKELKKRSG